MQSNKERSAEESYKKFLDIMLYDVPLNQLEELVVNDVTGYGTTLDEKILEIERLRKLVIDQREQGAGHEINFVVNPVHRRINTDNGLAVFIDEIEITMSINGNKNIIPLRFSSVLELINGSWKVVHLHGSVAVNTEGDTWHKEEHLRKIEELQKIVDEKTSELLNKNRELEIETALEKVRTIAMGMRKPDDMLDVCKTISVQLQSLGIKEIRNVQTAIFYEQRGTYMNYEYYAKHDKTFITETVYNNKIHNEFATKMQRGKGETFITHIEGDEVKNWIAYQKTTNVFIDKYLETASSLNYYWFSLGPVALGISTYHPLTEEEINLFKRFLKVFELAYLRFLDIEHAESQAREAKIEAALEKVRGHAMAMRSSEDLGATVNVFFKELKNLGFLPRRCGVAIIDEARRSAYNMITTADNIGDSFEIKGDVNLDSHFVLTNMLLNWKVQKDYFLELDTKQMEEYYRILRPQVAVTNFNDVRQYGYYLHFKEGMFYVWTDKELKVNDLQIFRRFTQVISLTYRRHLDLQKAEAQAREAKIEAALERVRSRTMGMQKSDELAETVSVLFKQLLDLGVKSTQLRTCGIVTFKENEPKGEVWITDITGEIIDKPFIAPYDEAPAYKTIYSKWKTGEKFLEINLKGADFLEHLTYVKRYSAVPNINLDELQKSYSEIFFHVLFFSQGYLFIISYEPLPEYHDIFKRFGALFQQTYTRFLDFKKVEAQNKIIQAENERKTRELEDARQLQLSMLPKELPKLPHLDIAVYMKTATEVGGDYYDFNLDADGTLTILVGDATGHGMMSGMMVSIMKSFFISNKNNIELKQFFENCNNSIKDMHLGRLMMATVGVQITSQKIIATNAGMPSLLYFRNKSKKAGEFVSNNLPLGGMKNTNYSLKEIRYEKGDTLLLMSDGFAELKNEKNEQYGYDRVKKEFMSVAQKNPNEIVEHLKTSATQWINGVEPDDDITFVVIKVK